MPPSPSRARGIPKRYATFPLGGGAIPLGDATRPKEGATKKREGAHLPLRGTVDVPRRYRRATLGPADAQSTENKHQAPCRMGTEVRRGPARDGRRAGSRGENGASGPVREWRSRPE